MKKFLNEFKEFALRGNVMDLAVGVIIGAAFQGVVKALTDNILAPIIGLFAQQNLDYLSVPFLGVDLKYGAFLTAVINFLITALVIFLLVRGMNRLAALGKPKKAEEEAPTTQICIFCRSEIPLEAVKCAHCTADLPAGENAVPQG